MYTYLLEHQIDSVKSKLLFFNKERQGKLVELGLEKRYRHRFNKYSLWDNILTEEEKDTLRSDRPRYWLKYYRLVQKRKSRFNRFHSLTLPYNDKIFPFWTNEIESEKYNTYDMESNPVKYFSYKLENFQDLEVYFYGIPDEMYSNDGDGYLTLYDRNSKLAYVLVCAS